MNPKNNNFLSYLARYWKLLVCFAVCFALASNNHVYGIFGTLIYGPVLFFGTILAVLLACHWFWPETIDQDAHDGTFVTAYRSIDPKWRVVIRLSVVCSLTLSAALIFAALIR